MVGSPPLRPPIGSSRPVLLVVLLVTSVAGAGAIAAGVAASPGDGSDDTRGNATVVGMNDTVEGTIDGPNDTDWYAVEVGDDQHLLAGIEAFDTGGGDEDPPREYKDLSVALYGPGGQRLDTEGTSLEIGPSTAGANHPVESGDTYYVAVASEYGDEAGGPYVEANGSQDYELDVESVPLDTNEPNDYYEPGTREPDSDPGAATAIAAGETVSANVLGIESDTYAVELEAGDAVTLTYDVTARLNHNGFAMPTRTVVLNSSGGEVADSEVESGSSGDASYSFTANESGTYYVTVTSETDSMAVFGVRGNDLTRYDLRLDVEGSARDADESPTTTPDTPTATATPAATVTPTVTTSGTDTASVEASSADDYHSDVSSVDDSGVSVSSGDGDGGDASDDPNAGSYESAGDAAEDGSGGARTAMASPTDGTVASGGERASAEASERSEEPVERARAAGAAPTLAAQGADETASIAHGQPGFGAGVGVVGVLLAIGGAARRRRSDR